MPVTSPTELEIYAPDGQRRTAPLVSGRITLGRSSANELCYPEDAGLSRQHVAFESDGAGWVVRDLNSKNGTLVNGVRVEGSRRLQPGDRITAGHLVIEFGRPAEPASSETVVFVEGADRPVNATLETNLEGVLAEDSSIIENARNEAALQSSLQVKALVKAGRELAGHRPLAELFPVILRLATEAVGATRGVLMTIEDGELAPRTALGDRFTISKTVRDRVLHEKASLLVRDATLDQFLKEQVSIVQQQIRSMMAVPLQTSDRVIGLIYVDSPFFVREFTKEDLSLLTVMANVAAIRIEHARLAEVELAERAFAKELEQAAEIQRRLLPAAPPRTGGLELAAHNAPCRSVGGDYYDFFPYPDGRVLMVVGDVAGKGMPAALLMSSLQARVQVLAEEARDLAALAAKLNRIIASNCPENRFISLFVCVVEPRTGELSYCNAGHNPALIVRAAGGIERLQRGGVILGILPSAIYESSVDRLDPGDVLVLFSDGVTEANPPDSEDEFGEDRLAESIRRRIAEPAEVIVERVLEDVAAWTAGAPPVDDLTLVVARRTSR